MKMFRGIYLLAAVVLLSLILAFAVSAKEDALSIARSFPDVQRLSSAEFLAATQEILMREVSGESGDFMFARLLVGSDYPAYLIALTNPAEYFIRYDGFGVLLFNSPEEAQAAYKKLLPLAPQKIGCSHNSGCSLEKDKSQFVIRWVQPDAPVQMPEQNTEFAATSVSASPQSIPEPNPFWTNIPYTPFPGSATGATYFPGGYMSWGAPYFGVYEFAQYLKELGRDKNADTLVVAIIDFGVDFGHPFLAQVRAPQDLLTPCAFFPPGHTHAGRERPAGDTHGTQVAGAIADMTRGFPVQLVSYSNAYYDPRLGTGLSLSSAIDQAVEDGIKLIHMSQYTVFCRPENRNGAICETMTRAGNKGTFIVLAAGNQSININENRTGDKNRPATITTRDCCDNGGGYCVDGHLSSKNLILVSGYNKDSTINSMSSYGVGLTVAAPMNPVSAWSQTAMGTSRAPVRHSYREVFGTSFAAPQITGLAALLLIENPNLTPAEIRSKLVKSARHHRAGNEIYGYGMPDLRLLIPNNVSVSNAQNSDNRYGIKFAQNIVSDKAEISVILPNNERVANANVAIYDMTGNVVFSTASTASTGSATGGAIIWDLRNSAGRIVANGTYLVVAEVRDRSGRVYQYSARLGVKR